jgi:threonine/homoserine/homoserine lactone efflux protein
MKTISLFLASLVAVAAIAAYFWWILAFAAVAGLVWLASKALRQHNELEAEEAERLVVVIERADEQHNWSKSRDARGTYGDGIVAHRRYQCE